MAAHEHTGIHPSRFLVAALVAVPLLGAAAAATAQPLRRNLSSYLLPTMKRASTKNMRIGSPCNVGVNCGAPTATSKCGVLAVGRVTTVEGGQVVAAQTFLRKPGAQGWQLFRNDDSPLDNLTLVGPPPHPQPVRPPLLPGTCDPGVNPH